MSDTPLRLADLDIHWPESDYALTKEEYSLYLKDEYKCHTAFSYELNAFPVTKKAGRGPDRTVIYCPKHYKNGLRFLNLEIACCQVSCSLRPDIPRGTSEDKQTEIWTAVDAWRRHLVFLSNVRKQFFLEVKNAFYSRDTTEGHVPKLMPASFRSPTLDTWLLREFHLCGHAPALAREYKRRHGAFMGDPLEFGMYDLA